MKAVEDPLAQVKVCDRTMSGIHGEGTKKLEVLHSRHLPGFESEGTRLCLSHSAAVAKRL